MKYLRRVLNATLRDKWHRSEICKANMSSHFPESLDPSLVNSAMCPKCPGKEWRTKSFRLHPRESDPKFVEGSGGVSTSSTLLAPFLVWSQQNYTIFLLIARYFWILLGLQPLDSPERKSGHENERVCTPTYLRAAPTLNLSIYEIIFSLFAKSECRIQINKHTWTETWVFVRVKSTVEFA